jgi:hypothetical protein
MILDGIPLPVQSHTYTPRIPSCRVQNSKGLATTLWSGPMDHPWGYDMIWNSHNPTHNFSNRWWIAHCLPSSWIYLATEIVHPYVPRRLAQIPSLRCSLGTRCRFSWTPRPSDDSYLRRGCKPISIGSIIPPMMRGGFLDPNWMLATLQVHRWVGRIMNLGSLEFQAVATLD